MLVTTYEDIVYYLRMRRIQMDISQPIFADLAGISKSTFTKWEQGLRAPTLPNLINWMEAAGCRFAIVPEEEQDPALLKILNDTLKSQIDHTAISKNRRRQVRGGARDVLKPMLPFHVTGEKHGIAQNALRKQAARKKRGQD